MVKRAFWFVVAAALAVLASTSAFTLHETEFGVVTRMGSPTRELKSPGLYFKAPWPIDRVERMDRRLLLLDVPTREQPPREFFTRDKKNIEVAVFACWRVVEPLTFLKVLRSRDDAEDRLRDKLMGACGEMLAQHDLAEFFSTTPGQMKLPDITRSIHRSCQARIESAWGIELVDVQLKRINLPEANRSSVFERMRTERKRFASEYLNAGDKEASAIRNAAKTREQEILGEAYEQARGIEGQADAQAYAIWNAAFRQDPEFYEFLRRLESYEKTLTRNTTLFLPADHPYLRSLGTWKPSVAPPTEAVTPAPEHASPRVEKENVNPGRSD